MRLALGLLLNLVHRFPHTSDELPTCQTSASKVANGRLVFKSNDKSLPMEKAALPCHALPLQLEEQMLCLAIAEPVSPSRENTC